LFAFGKRIPMKQIAAVARELNLGVAGAYAQETPARCASVRCAGTEYGRR
jgi:hypothetical protein